MEKMSKGITLIALVVTIIVLLILAGISISMLAGDNGILQRATDAKKNTETASAKEQIQIEVLGSYGTNGKLDMNTLKTNLEKIGATVSGENPLTVTLNGQKFTIDSDGDVEKAGPSIAVDENSLTITNTDGSSITKGQVEQGTALKITFNASVEGGTVTVDPSLPHITTAEEISAKEVIFNITASVPGETVEPIEYKVSLKDVYKSNVVSMEELKAQASKYYGYDVINYAETLPSNLQDTEWQLFYAGALDGETEERIYLISKGFVKNTVLPAKNGAKPIPTDGSNYKARFGSNPTTGIMPKYTGSENVAASIKKYNKDYFKDYTSTSSNMKAVAYMLDTDIWSPFATSIQNYAEWAIGGPTVELLFTAYNKYKGTSYEADAVSATGYQVRKTSGDTFANSISRAIAADTSTVDNPYSISNQSSQAPYYWLASPSNISTSVLCVSEQGDMNGGHYSLDSNIGFRPLVLLSTNFLLERTTSGGKEVFKIVPKTE